MTAKLFANRCKYREEIHNDIMAVRDEIILGTSLYRIN